MTAFEFVFGLVSVVASLGLAHLVSGFVALVRAGGRVRYSLAHALWMWTAFTLTMGNWGAMWSLRALATWPATLVLAIVVMTVGQYAVCALVVPEVATQGPIDLAVFHERERKRYAGALVVLAVLALVENAMTASAYAGWLRDSAACMIDIALPLLAIAVPARWAQRLAAIGLAALGTYMLFETCNIVAA